MEIINDNSDGIEKLRGYYLYLTDVFSEMCKKKGIRYFLYAGSLLGAVRHQGFIPWDDDVDICVYEEDMNSLMQADWPEGITLTKHRFFHYLLSIDNTLMINIADKLRVDRIKRCLPAGIQIDIFVLQRTDKKNSNNDELVTIGNQYFYPDKFFGKGISAKFEDRVYNIPENSDGILRIAYGNYKKPSRYNKNIHKIFIDYNNGVEAYVYGGLRIPSSKEFKADFSGVMVSTNQKIDIPLPKEHKGVVRNLHEGGWLPLNNLIQYTGLQDIKLVEVGAYAGEATKIFAENDNVKTIYAIQNYRPWYDERSYTANSNLKEAEVELDVVVSMFPGKIQKFDGELKDFLQKNPDCKPDIIYIDEQFRNIANVLYFAIKSGARFIAGHDYTDYWHEVKDTVDSIFGGPDKIFKDSSWIKDISNIKI